MSSQPKTFLTPEQYLELDRAADYKSEYHGGEMFAMAGASWTHNRLVWNLVAQLGRQLGSGPCQGCPSDMRVHVPATGLYTYPDAVVVCGEPSFLDERRDTLLNPTLIVEVLSPSTEAYDRSDKFENYRSIDSLTAFMMVASERVHVELYTRQPGGTWLLAEAREPQQTIEIPSVGCSLTLADLYAKVEFA